MSNVCKHYDVAYEKRQCIHCGREFWICPICSRYVPFARFCESCGSRRMRKVLSRLGYWPSFKEDRQK